MEKLKALRAEVETGEVDIVGHQSPYNRDDIYDCYAFDYCDFLWGIDDEVEALLRYRNFRGRVTLLAFTDRLACDLGLPEGAETCCKVVLSKDYDPSEVYYDFAGLVG